MCVNSAGKVKAIIFMQRSSNDASKSYMYRFYNYTLFIIESYYLNSYRKNNYHCYYQSSSLVPKPFSPIEITAFII